MRSHGMMAAVARRAWPLRAGRFASLFVPFFFLTSLLCCMRRVHHTEPSGCPAIEKETLP